MWIFGYGSLIWKVDFPIVEAKAGYIRGHVRRFWQASTDHRGLPERPGRVVTLIPREQWLEIPEEEVGPVNETWGMAYKIAESEVEKVMDHLNYREKNGYTVHYVDVFQSGQEQPVVSKALVYIGTLENSEYVGPAPIKEMALQISKAVGPSGPNRDYLFHLETALEDLGDDAGDAHVSRLVSEVKALDKSAYPDVDYPSSLPSPSLEVGEEDEED
ncbi:cation transport regulator-like protein 2-like protein [Piptocephalis cylindrospora]|uniref:glutathione-specific gamma-glutamylcyclotransferase n=1 Tax=Piptocephalis cylindrospora TaxID=1907219 RepID=A0A4P9Y4M0_9FUNG|nr:cation transport regulator-like protein 2-like protein [Piptocephalis cylindrospora]|eukprot:RKP13823.1 cation transport regulator-like protein 2-like protein [Piptocephalis cylindrospora]